MLKLPFLSNLSKYSHTSFAIHGFSARCPQWFCVCFLVVFLILFLNTNIWSWLMIQKNMFQCLLNEMPITDLQDRPTKRSAKYLGNHFRFQSVSLKINICLTKKVAQCFFSWILYNHFCYFVPAWTHAWTVLCGIQAAADHLQRSLQYNNYLPHPFPFVFHASRQTAEAHMQFYKVTKSKLTSHNSAPPCNLLCVCVCGGGGGVTIFVSKQVAHRLYFHSHLSLQFLNVWHYFTQYWPPL